MKVARRKKYSKKKLKERKQIVEYLLPQRRFKHLMDKPDEISRLHAKVVEMWKKFGFRGFLIPYSR